MKSRTYYSIGPKETARNNFCGAGCQPAAELGDFGRLAICPTLKSGSYFQPNPYGVTARNAFRTGSPGT